MKIEELVYTKKAGANPLRAATPSYPVANIVGKDHTRRIVYSPDYEKGVAALTPAVVYILSGGEDREKNFFKALKGGSMLSSCIHVIFQSKKGQGLQPYQMDELWQKSRKTGKICVDGREYRVSSIDSVFLVTDVDEFESQLVKILKDKDKNDQGHWIISNPCIEIWLYYCYRADLDVKVKALRYVSRKKRSQRMKSLNHKLFNGSIDPRKAFGKTKTGITNSIAHYRTMHYGIPSLFATAMHLMMVELLDFIKSRGRSFEEYQEANRKKIEAFLEMKK